MGWIMSLHTQLSKHLSHPAVPHRALSALISCLILLTMLAGCGDPFDADEAVESHLQSLSIVERASLLIAVPVRLDGSMEADSIARALLPPEAGAMPGALWVEAATVDGLAAAHATLPEAWAPIVAASVDKGVGSVVSGATLLPPISDLVRAGWDTKSLIEAGRLIGREAALAGITLAMVNGPPIVERIDRLAELRDSSAMAEGYAAVVAGATAEGATPGLHLYWSPDSLLSESSWDRNRFAVMEGAALDGGMSSRLAALSLGSVGLPALDAEGRPADRSASIIRGVVRRDAGFSGLIVATLLDTDEEPDTMVQLLAAVEAGADLVVTRIEPARVAAALVQAVTDGTIPQSHIDSAARRVLHQMVRRRMVPTPAIAAEGAIRPEGPTFIRDRAIDFLARFEPDAGADSTASARSGFYGWPVSPDPDAAGMSGERLASVDRLMRAGLEDSVFTAGAVVVLRHGGVAYAEGFGVTSDSSAVDPENTLFDVASLTKVVGSATAAAILIDRGDLRLDDPVRRYLPEFRGEGKEDVTISQLLSHSSGLPSGLWLYGSASSSDEALTTILEHRLMRPPGTDVVYSDLGIILLAEIVERMAGQRIDRFLAEQLFIPLGLSNTMYLPPWSLRGRVVPTVGENERPYPLIGVIHDANAFRLDGIAGHAGIFSTAADLAVFSEMMLRSGEVDGVRILSDSIVEIFRTRQTGAGERTLGWDTPADVSSAGRFASARTFGHTGYTGTSIWIDPEYDIAVVLLTNRTYPGAGSRAILDLRTSVHEAIYQSITDRAVPRRPGAR